MALTTLAAVKRDLALSAMADDVVLGEWIIGASRWIESYCNQPIEATNQSLIGDGRGGTTLFLPYTPVLSISSMRVDGQPVLAATAGGTDIGYFFDKRGLVRLRGMVFSRGVGNVEVAYRAGYEPANIPPEIERACVRLVGFRYKERDRLGQSSKGVGGETISYLTAAASEDVLKILDNYRRVVPG